MYVNLYKDHFSYIHNMKRYSKSYQCPRCGKFWKNGFQLNRHEQTCEGSVKYKFPGGAYCPAASIFAQLEEYRIEILERLKYYPYWATYDIEAMLVPQQDLNNTEKLQWTNKHVPASVSICSNVPEYTEPVCFISHGSPHELVEQMVEYLETISAAAMSNVMEDPDMQTVFESISNINWTPRKKKTRKKRAKKKKHLVAKHHLRSKTP